VQFRPARDRQTLLDAQFQLFNYAGSPSGAVKRPCRPRRGPGSCRSALQSPKCRRLMSGDPASLADRALN